MHFLAALQCGEVLGDELPLKLAPAIGLGRKHDVRVRRIDRAAHGRVRGDHFDFTLDVAEVEEDMADAFLLRAVLPSARVRRQRHTAVDDVRGVDGDDEERGLGVACELELVVHLLLPEIVHVLEIGQRKLARPISTQRDRLVVASGRSDLLPVSERLDHRSTIILREV